jgi:hypothetical protein
MKFHVVEVTPDHPLYSRLGSKIFRFAVCDEDGVAACYADAVHAPLIASQLSKL